MNLAAHLPSASTLPYLFPQHPVVWGPEMLRSKTTLWRSYRKTRNTAVPHRLVRNQETCAFSARFFWTCHTEQIRLFSTACLFVLSTNGGWGGGEACLFLFRRKILHWEPPGLRLHLCVPTCSRKDAHYFGKGNINLRKGRQVSKLKGWCPNSCLITLMHHDCNRVTFEEGRQEPRHTGWKVHSTG